VEIKESNALEHSNAAVAEECVAFNKLCDLNWANDVSAIALHNLADRKHSGVFYLPLTADVVKLNDHLVHEANAISSIDNIDQFAKLSQVILAKVILFNRKRQGAVSKMTVEDYSNKGKASSNLDMVHGLTEFEKGLLDILERTEIRGKRGVQCQC